MSPIPPPDYPFSIPFAYPVAGWGEKMDATALPSDEMGCPLWERLRGVCNTRLPYRVREIGPFSGMAILTERE